MSRLLLGEWKVLLRCVFGGFGSGGGGGFEREEAFEDALCLPLRSMCEVNPDIHTSWTTQGGVKSLNMIGGSEQ